MAIPVAAAVGRLVSSGMAKKFSRNFARDAARSMFSGGGKSEAFDPKNLRMEIDVASLNMTLMRMDGDRKALKKAARRAMRSAAEELMEAVKENMSSTAHSKEYLADADHPYAHRHGRIQTTALGGMKPYEIHDQTGTMLRALYVSSEGNDSYGGSSVAINDAIAPHAKFVVDGTRTMLKRDVINGTLEEPETMARIKKRIVKDIRARGAGGKYRKLDLRWTFK